MMHKGGMEGTCGGGSWQKKHKGNKYRAGNDDGSQTSRKKAGPMSTKHYSSAHMGSHKGNPY